MTTFNDLVEEVSLNLAGYTMRQDRSTYLTTSVTSTGRDFVIASSENIAKGLVEVGEELILMGSFDRTANTLVAEPYGRGFLGTSAVAHSANERVTIAPTFPRQAIKRAINDTILAVYPDAFGVGTATLTYTPAVNTYALPSDVETVLAASYKTIGPSQEWLPIRNWRVDTNASVTDFNSTASITLYSFVNPGSTVQVTYMRQPAILEDATDDFETITGFMASMKDVVVLGACYRLLSFIDPGRLTFSSPEADTQTGRIQFGSGTNTAKYVYALYQQRLSEEVRKLKKRYPIRVHYTR